MKQKKMPTIIKILSWLMFFVFCYAGSSLDSVSWAPFVLTVISMTYLIIVGIHYGLVGGEEEE
ncbi:MAG: hypothetical protein E7284_10060 [Lachnospiraceae bacterium]|nr:hypothetical protein [Lachnospiraceae bacterium]